jgi:hypothetical protein
MGKQVHLRGQTVNLKGDNYYSSAGQIVATLLQ